MWRKKTNLGLERREGGEERGREGKESVLLKNKRKSPLLYQAEGKKKRTVAAEGLSGRKKGKGRNIPTPLGKGKGEDALSISNVRTKGEIQAQIPLRKGKEKKKGGGHSIGEYITIMLKEEK